jgi:hypothetical protein
MERGQMVPFRAYDMKEFEFRDPDVYRLWFGQDTDEPPTVAE